MSRRVIISTHHKCGTVWLSKTFSGIAEALSIPVGQYDSRNAEATVPAAPCIIIDHGSWWFDESNSTLRNNEDRGFHLIRDPRDLIISAAHYHLNGNEDWLFRPVDYKGGLDYRETLRQLPADKDRYLFEMDNASGRVIRKIAAWDYARPGWLEFKYETLIVDTEMKIFSSQILPHLGFNENDIEIARPIFWKHSLFGAKGEKLVRKKKKHGHVRSGKPRQWAGIFDQELARAFVERFGNVLIDLGYEPDNSWVDRCYADCQRPARVMERDGVVEMTT